MITAGAVLDLDELPQRILPFHKLQNIILLNENSD